MHEGMVVYDPEFLELRDQFFTCVPSWRRVPQWLLAGELGEDINGTCEYCSLLLCGENGDVFVSVAVKTSVSVLSASVELFTSSLNAQLMAGISDFRQLFRERLDCMSRCKEGCFYVVFLV